MGTVRRRVVIGLELFEVVGALVGTVGLLRDGYEFMGRTVEPTELPFESWVLAGVALFLLNGVVPTVALVLDLRRHRLARAAHLTVGIVLMAWIVVQVAMIGLVFVLQPLMFVVGAAITVLAVRQPV